MDNFNEFAVEEVAKTTSRKWIPKFSNRYYTADGVQRAFVPLVKPDTLWFNTGTLCNITCKNCYIESSPQNDRLVYISADEVNSFLDQIKTRKWPVETIGLTGGEPFMNFDIIEIVTNILSRGYQLMVLTNAMRPMMRPKIMASLLEIQKKYGEQLILRVSLDHYDEGKHDFIRGKGSFQIALKGLEWLSLNGFQIAIAGRMYWNENEAQSREGFERFIIEHDLKVDPYDPNQLVLFPEMDVTRDATEITTSCWKILNKNPTDIMCSSSRMVIKRRNSENPVVVSCTLLPYSEEFEMGETLAEAEKPVFLNHKFCSQFCVLGGASCKPKE
ncbi:MAG: radical SAM protein [Rhodobacteraceae bacterium]|nr:radical SAM protein [Paracoccaceae bacterium]